MKKMIAILMLVTLILLAGCGGKETANDPVPKDFRGLVLIAPAGTTVFLHTEFEGGQVVPVDQVYETEEYDYYCYADQSGAFRCECSANGYYQVTQNIYITPEEAQGRTDCYILNSKRAGQGWEPREVTIHTEEFRGSAITGDAALWQDYMPALQSPYFTGEHAAHQTTTQEEMLQFIRDRDDSDDDMYVYNTGYSAVNQQEIPIVVFTRADLSGATTLEEAAALMGQEKPLVIFRGQMHGNEPAGGEAALAWIHWLDSALGDTYLDKMNICVIPRQNPDGAQKYERRTMTQIDINRDSLNLEAPETVAYVKTCLLLEPEIIVDGHEWNNHATDMTLNANVLVGVGFTPDNGEEFRQKAMDISARIFSYEAQIDQSCRFYTNRVNSATTSVSRCYASMQGTMFFLLETRGIGMGLSGYDHRIMGHMAGTKAVLDYVAEDPQEIMDVVNRERRRIIETGSVYSEENQVYLDLVSTDDPTLAYTWTNYHQDSTERTTEQVIPAVFSTADRQRIAPTAYVIPAGESYTDPILALMDKHGIAYTFIPAGSTVMLQQYDSKEADYLTDERAVTFENGAYVFCKNQVRGKLLSIFMEPDVDDVAENNCTLVQRGMLKGEDGVYPLYRYIHDLNSDGFIDCQ